MGKSPLARKDPSNHGGIDPPSHKRSEGQAMNTQSSTVVEHKASGKRREVDVAKIITWEELGSGQFRGKRNKTTYLIEHDVLAGHYKVMANGERIGERSNVASAKTFAIRHSAGLKANQHLTKRRILEAIEAGDREEEGDTLVAERPEAEEAPQDDVVRGEVAPDEGWEGAFPSSNVPALIQPAQVHGEAEFTLHGVLPLEDGVSLADVQALMREVLRGLKARGAQVEAEVNVRGKLTID